MIRLCVSDVAWCSGLNPCEHCHMAIMGRVIPRAMVAGGFNNDPVVAKSFIDAYRESFRGLQAEAMAALQAKLVEDQQRLVADAQKQAAAHAEVQRQALAHAEALATEAQRQAARRAETTEARLDTEGTAKPLTEIAAIMPTGAVHPSQAIGYVARPTGIAPQTSDTSTTETSLPEPPAATKKEEPIPPPNVEGLDNKLTEDEEADADEGGSEAPNSDTVIAVRRRRGLPRIARGPKRKLSTKAASK